MNKLKSIAGWVVRGGDQARAEFASQSEAIRDLQRRLDATEAALAQGSRVEAELRDMHSDLIGRLSAMRARLDALEVRCADHDAVLDSLLRSVAPPTDE